MANIMAEPVAESLPLFSSESSFISGTPSSTEASSNVASSLASTPPTSVPPDDMSLASDQDIMGSSIASTLALEKSPLSLPLLSPLHDGAKQSQSLHTPQLEAQMVAEVELPALLPSLQATATCPERESEPLPLPENEPQSEQQVTTEKEVPALMPSRRDEPEHSAPEQVPLPEQEAHGRSPAQTKPQTIDPPETIDPTEPQTEPQTDLQTKPQTERQTERQTEHTVEEETTDPDLQLRREFEAQHTPEPAPEVEACQQTPTASAIVVVPKPVIPKAKPVTEPPLATPSRPRRARASLPVYNMSKLFGHATRRAKGDGIKTTTKPKRRGSVGDAAINTLDLDGSVGAPATPHGANNAKKNKPDANEEIKQEPVTRRVTRLSGTPVPTAVTAALFSIGRRGKKTVEDGLSRVSRELRQLQDTKEFAHIDDRPILETVWSNGKFVDPRTLNQPVLETRASKRVKTSHNAEPEEPVKAEEPAANALLPAVPELPERKRTAKNWLEKGLYAGQPTPADLSMCLTKAEKKRLAQYPELSTVWKPNKTLPPPMFNGLRLLIQGRDFKLPYDICNPLPPGQPKPAAYRTMTRNRFVGDAAAYWKKQPHLQDFQSKCVCKPEDGCAEDCQNRIMLYECDDTNCNVGKDLCSNRAFQTLQERTKMGGRYRIGVEVYKTDDRGYGVRSNRCFRPHQIIMEYTGEIITEEECERRMNDIYKDNECYYLMSFDQNMIIDATTGSIARFVNHSCSPNCRMIKWIVGGQPRMALFAGDRPIMTGEELTYDYNFDPFSAKNVQKCLCGAENCRGVLGPRPREAKPSKSAAAASKDDGPKNGVKAAKRKLKEMLANDDDVYDDVEGASTMSVKKRKIAVATGAASALSKSGLKVAKGAASALKRSVSSISVSARAALSSKARATSSPLRRTSTGGVVKSSAKLPSPGKGRGKTPEKAAITTTKAAMAAITSLRITVKKPAGTTTAQASGSSAASQTIVAAAAAAPKAKAKALSTADGNAKNKPSLMLKPKTPAKRTPPKKGPQHSGYTPPSSPKPTTSSAAAKPSRKKMPTRKILESNVAGTASVTKPKARPAAKAKAKAKAVAAASASAMTKRRGLAAAINSLMAVERGNTGAREEEARAGGEARKASPSTAEGSTIEAKAARQGDEESVLSEAPSSPAREEGGDVGGAGVVPLVRLVETETGVEG